MISKAHRSVVEVLLYAIVCFVCFTAAVPLVVRWRTDALSEDYAEVRNKAAVIAFSIVAQCAVSRKNPRSIPRAPDQCIQPDGDQGA